MQCNISVGNIAKIQQMITICGVLNPFLLQSYKSNKSNGLRLVFDIIEKRNNFGELTYEVDDTKPLELSFGEAKFILSDIAFLKKEFFDIIDEDIIDFLHNQGMEDQSDEYINNTIEEKIKTVYPIESLYYRILNETEKGIPYANKDLKIDLLFKIVMQKNKIKDMEVVKDFINNFYETKYANIFLQYFSLPDYMYEKALKDISLDINTKSQIAMSIEKLPDSKGVIDSKNIAEIENYYFKMFDNIFIEENVNHIVVQMLENNFVSPRMMQDILNRYEFEFVLGLILRQRNCPLDIFQKALSFDAYFDIIINNPYTPEEIITTLVKEKISLNKTTALQRACEHPNASLELKNIIHFRNFFLEGLSIDLNSITGIQKESLPSILNSLQDVLLTQKVKIFSDEITDFLSLLKNYDNGYLISDCLSLFNEVMNLSKELEMNSILLLKARQNEFTEEDVELVVNQKDSLINQILAEIKDDKIANTILYNLMEKVTGFKNNIIDKLLILKHNTNISYDQLNIVNKYKNDFIMYIEQLQKDGNDEALIVITNALVNQNNTLEDGTISFSKPEMTKILTIIEKNQDKTIVSNVLMLQKRA